MYIVLLWERRVEEEEEELGKKHLRKQSYQDRKEISKRFTM